MLPKIIHFGDEGREKIGEGIKILTDAVKSTLGPRGRNVLIGNKGMRMRFTKDGVSVAKEVCLYDEIQDAGAHIIREAALNTCNKVGDGTTTATVIAQNIISNGISCYKDKIPPIALKIGIEKALEKVLEFLKSHSKEIQSDEDVINIATISANGDRELGKIIADTFKKVGKDGAVTIEESSSGNTEVSIVEGLQLDKGYISPYFVTNPAKMTCDLDNPYILIYDKKISTFYPLLSLFESIAKSHDSLLIIAEDVDHEALGMLVKNKMSGLLKVAAIKTPSFGKHRDYLMDDLNVMTGSMIVSDHTGIKLESIVKEMLGRAKKAIISQDKTIIMGGYGKKEDIHARCDFLQHEIDNAENEADKNHFYERLAKLNHGVAVIKVGGTTEFEVKEKKDRVEDAVHATRAALKGGILPGGGISLLRASHYLNSLDFLNEIDNHETPVCYDMGVAHGIYLIEKALKAPFNQIMENAGLIPEEIEETLISIGKGPSENPGSAYGYKDLISQSKATNISIEEEKEKQFNQGYDALNFKYVDMVEAGIIDPTDVVLTSFKDAVSIASMMLSTNVVMIEENEITINDLHSPSNPYKIRI